jgi:hypothetical protein
MAESQTVLSVLLTDKGLQRYGSFCAAYDKAARALDGRPGSAPSRAQFHRWLTGEMRSLPYTDHCRVLEHMMTGYSASQLFASCPDGEIPAPARRPPEARPGPAPGHLAQAGGGTADVAAVFATRSEFAASVQPTALFDGARRIRAAGLSLNLICQQVPDQYLRNLVCGGAGVTCLFLDPAGEAIKAREREEEFPPGHLSGLTKVNIDTMSRLRDRLPGDARERFRLAVYDETIRFNIILVDDSTCVAQPYLPSARGLDSPTLLIRRASATGGLYPVFEQVYEVLAERSRPA